MALPNRFGAFNEPNQVKRGCLDWTELIMLQIRQPCLTILHKYAFCMNINIEYFIFYLREATGGGPNVCV